MVDVFELRGTAPNSTPGMCLNTKAVMLQPRTT